MTSQNSINQRVRQRAFVTTIINSVSSLLEEGKFQRLESLKRTLEEKMSLLQRLDDEVLESLKKKQKIWNEIERSSNIRLNIQQIIFQMDSKLEEISISEERSSSNSTNSNVNSNVNSFLENSFDERNNSNGKLPNVSIKCFIGNLVEFHSFFDSFRTAINENDSY